MNTTADTTADAGTPTLGHGGRRAPLGLLWAGLVATAVTTAVPLVDHVTDDRLGAHLRSGYPDYPQDQITAATTTYLAYLTTLGVIGALCWLATIVAARRGLRHTRSAALLVFSGALLVAIADLTVRDTSGDLGLPPLFGWIGLVPCVFGALALVSWFRGALSPRGTARGARI